MKESFSESRIFSSAQKKRWKIFITSSLVHALVILGPLGYFFVADMISPPKPNPFRVKIGGRELSTGPEVGPPERTRPSPDPGRAPAKPAPAKPKPAEPAPAKPAPVKPKPAKPKPKPAKPKAKPKKTAAKKKTAAPKKNRKTTAKKSVAKKPDTRQRRPTSVEEAQKGVYRPGGGSNFNKNVPIGTRNRAQQKGKQDNRTPGGGATEAMEKYGKRLSTYLETRWTQPADIFLNDNRPSVLIELQIAADGRVISGRIVEASKIAAMDESVRLMLKNLDRVPIPPGGATTLQIYMQTE